MSRLFIGWFAPQIFRPTLFDSGRPATRDAGPHCAPHTSRKHDVKKHLIGRFLGVYINRTNHKQYHKQCQGMHSITTLLYPRFFPLAGRQCTVVSQHRRFYVDDPKGGFSIYSYTESICSIRTLVYIREFDYCKFKSNLLGFLEFLRIA